MTIYLDNDKINTKLKSDIYELFINAVPVFHSEIPIQTRNILYKKFADQFEEYIKSSFSESVRYLENDLSDEITMENYLTWLTELYLNIGVEIEIIRDKEQIKIKVLECPWMADKCDNPIFFMLCRTIITKSHALASMGGHVRLACKRTENIESCHFEILMD